ncbi:AmmeMemoRadiSam system protein B [Patescibacteria group bacterium]
MFAIRPSAFAGQFYPESKKELKSQIEEFLKEANPKDIKGKVKALISPHAGYQFSGPIAAYGYKLLRDTKYLPSGRHGEIQDTIILGTSHHMMFPGVALTNFSYWETPLGKVRSSSLHKKLESNPNFSLVNEAHISEHSIEVQLPFMQSVLKDFQITPVLTGRVDNHKEIAQTLSKHLDERSLIIVSSDLCHYLPYEEANEEDNKTIQQILDFDTYIDSEQACGTDGIIILIEIAKLLKWKVKLLDYRNSGDTAGDKDKVVGYTSIIFYK